ncbi:zeta toxin family protein [Paeniglutamicibacter gangotriensis]|uniref:UDP-N-acetylglucosamine kinase n=1 Tax=Paeniglutamicibacter gangotriensis Lz1y TaxID=1276920 RepID=M7MS43_9MICC|nr:zeta toxin family protein [Paeniglutamicibacter gangotriensis]EMQ99227.1 Zeta toxin [Paeniglutamicibacter gangotriensis Lz1y]
MASDALRLVERELNELSKPGASFDRNSVLATYRPDKPVSSDRIRFQRRLIDEFLSEDGDEIEKGAEFAVLITAGPPGAGKSTRIDEFNLVEKGWRKIDADRIKLKLLAEARNSGRFDPQMSTLLADGYPVMLNELSSLVHNESVFLADQIMTRCLEAGENIVIEGTLSWEGRGPYLLEALELHDYRKVVILDVEVELATALEQAYTRWAQGRNATIEGRSTEGGRFTLSAAITSMYQGGKAISCCNRNAVDFFTDEKAASFDDIKLVVAVNDSEATVQEYQRILGEYATPEPTYLSDR